MSLHEELRIANYLEHCWSLYLTQKRPYECENYLDEAFYQIRRSERGSLTFFNPETIVRFCEIALRIK